MTQPDRDQEPDELRDVIRRLDREFGPRRDDEPSPVYGENRPLPQGDDPAPPEGPPPQAPGPQPLQLAFRPGHPHAVWVILALNLLIYIVPAVLDLVGVRINGFLPSDFVRALGAKNNAAIYLGGQYYRLWTAMFLHGGLLHIAFNAWALYALGPETERIYGTGRFLALYLIAGLAGGIASYALTPANSVGASGAIFGLIGGLAVFYYASRRTLGEIGRQQLGSLVTVMMINLFIGFSAPGIDNMAHLGGLIGGTVVGWLLAPRLEVDPTRYPPTLELRFLPIGWPGALGVLAVLALAAFLVVPQIR
jgi:rhomboid protease GluP